MSTEVTVRPTFVWGSFQPTLEAVIPESLFKAACEVAVKHAAQRTPSTEAEKTLDGHNWPTGKRGGKLRPEKYNRAEAIPYSAENAEKLAACFTGPMALWDGGPVIQVRCIKVEEDVSEAGNSMKGAERFVDLLLGDESGEGEATLRSTLRIVGGFKDAATADRNKLVEYTHAAKLAARK